MIIYYDGDVGVAITIVYFVQLARWSRDDM